MASVYQGSSRADDGTGVGELTGDAKGLDHSPTTSVVVGVTLGCIGHRLASGTVGKDIESVKGPFVWHVGRGNCAFVLNIVGPKHTAGRAHWGSRTTGMGKDCRRNQRQNGYDCDNEQDP